MCLTVDKEKTLAFYKKHRNHKTVTVYKRLIKDVGCRTFTSPYMCRTYYLGRIKISDSKLRFDKNRRSNVNINVGIHAYVSKKIALTHLESYETLCEFKMDMKDFIAVGKYGDIVATKMKFTEILSDKPDEV